MIQLFDKHQIELLLRRSVSLNLYAIGDLDDFFWPHTRWFAWPGVDASRAVALLYEATELPTLLALTSDDTAMGCLLDDLIPALGPEVYVHLSPGLEPHLETRYELSSHGEHLRMMLGDSSVPARVDTAATVRLGSSDLPVIRALYEASYPGNWFDERMLKTGQYFGIRRDGGLAAIAGIHVYSPEYGVAALGNITTHPDCRRQGFGRAVMARVCQSLEASGVNHIGLNVHSGNASAIRCYETLGFQKSLIYEEYMARRRG